MNVSDARDSATVFWLDQTSQPTAAGVVRSPRFRCEDPPGFQGGLSNGQTIKHHQVRGPGIDCFMIIPTASVGATLTLAGYDHGSVTGTTVWTSRIVQAAGTYVMTDLLSGVVAFVAPWPARFLSPFPIWQLSFTNGAVDQASAITFAVRAGGWF